MNLKQLKLGQSITLASSKEKFICPRCKQPGKPSKMKNDAGKPICQKCEDYIKGGSKEF